jgi:hypothetical protein
LASVFLAIELAPPAGNPSRARYLSPGPRGYPVKCPRLFVDWSLVITLTADSGILSRAYRILTRLFLDLSMEDILSRFWADLVGRLHGPLTFRLFLQPVMAILYAVRDGVNDARAGRPAYFWTIFTEPNERGRLLREGWKAVTRIIILGVVMDVLYQLIVFRWIYPTELIIIVLLLAFVPYLLARGPVNRIARIWIPRKVSTR